MIVFLSVTVILLPVIFFPTLVGIAFYKKWWSNHTLGIIGGVIGVLSGVYYIILFTGGVHSLLDAWPIWLICLLICGLGSWYSMRNFIIIMEQRQLEKEQKKKKTS